MCPPCDETWDAAICHVLVNLRAPQVGVVDIPAEEVVKKGRLMPGNIFLVDFDAHRVVDDKEIKEKWVPSSEMGGRGVAGAC